MSGFGTGVCGMCGARIRWDDDFCSGLCELEAVRQSEGDAPVATADVSGAGFGCSLCEAGHVPLRPCDGRVAWFADVEALTGEAGR